MVVRAHPALSLNRQYNGRVYDPGTGFHDYGARLYWPQIGRFVQDPDRE
jgi:RHS repeat-associated protein